MLYTIYILYLSLAHRCEVLSERFPTWRLVALTSLAQAARPMAGALDLLAARAAEEIKASLPTGAVTLHCVGHSMGGIILRGALPAVLQDLGGRVTLGHYLSLSTPHLGIRAAWSSPHAWRNLAAPLTACVTSQISQLAVEDEPDGASKRPQTPRNVALSMPPSSLEAIS